MNYQVIIVGGGFSALVLANVLKEHNVNYLLLEKNDRVGKKILATGNGRCNVSNEDLSPSHYHGNNANFCEYAIKSYDNRHMAGFFNKLGVIFTREEGKIYPASLQANAVLDALRLGLKDDRILTSKKVEDVYHDKKSSLYKVTCSDKKAYYAKNVALCVGGKVGSHFGTDGSSYALVEKYGHKITPLYPSLVQLTTDKSLIKGLKGVKQRAKVVGVVDGKELAAFEGDVLFSDCGVSGNTIFQLSAYLTSQKFAQIKITYLPSVSESEILESLNNRIASYPEERGESLLNGLVHSRIGSNIVKLKGLENLKYREFSKKQLIELVGLLKSTVLPIVGTQGFDSAQVTKGGVSTDCVDKFTMESKLQSGLFFCGEVLDVDGDCGGYNLQWAYSSAMCAASAILGKKL